MDKIKPPKRLMLNVFTGNFEYVVDNNFSYQSVPLNKKLIIYPNMQMAVYGPFEVNGILDLRGALILEP